MASAVGGVVKQLDRAVQHGGHDIHTPVIVEISERDSAVWSFLLEIGAGPKADVFELPVPEVTEN